MDVDYSYGGTDTDEDARAPVYEDEAPPGRDSEDWGYGEYDIEDADDSLMKCTASLGLGFALDPV